MNFTTAHWSQCLVGGSIFAASISFQFFYKKNALANNGESFVNYVVSSDSATSSGFRSELHSVLEFWFGGDLKENYRRKWFPSGSKDTQRFADEEISRRYSHLLDYLTNLNSIKEINLKSFSLREKIALIIVLDQFSRHVYRFRQLSPDSDIRKKADCMALQLSESILDASESTFEGLNSDNSDISLPSLSRPHGAINWDKNLSIGEFVFSLMPLRHSATLDRLNKVIEEIDRREGVELMSTDLLKKFRKQTMRRLEHLNDRAKVL
jgi:uncharacterized protein (DUF924 family)